MLAHDLCVGQLQRPIGLYQVMIHARNAVVVQSLRRLLHAELDTDTPTRIGVMYGALHFDDLLQQVRSLLALLVQKYKY